MKELFTLRTVRKKIVMLSKITGLVLIFSYILSASLPVSENISFGIWFACVVILILAIDFFMGRFISKPVSELNISAKRMAGLDFSAACSLSSKDEFGELSVSLNQMAENLRQAISRLEDANTQLEKEVEKERLLLKERKELVDHLSHEMKTPLGIIQAYAEGLQDTNDEEKRQIYSRVIISETRRMNDLIVTLLDLSALESGASQLALTRFDFVELTETVAGRLLVDAPDHNFDLQYELPEEKIFVYTDKRRMEQVLDNLIINAKKNIHPGGILRLELTADNRFLHFSVFNQGNNISEEDLPKIWTKFYRANRTAYSGSGLGLSIAAQILSMQGLSYGAENLPDGVRFYFSIPISE